MKARTNPILLLIVLVLRLIASKSVYAAPHKIPRLSPYMRTISRNPKDNNLSPSSLSKDYKTYFYKQVLDHFNYGVKSYTTFKQRYVMNFKYWGGGNSSSPILAYLGAEAPLDDDLLSPGYLDANAPHFKALQVYIEHRYYGKSNPFGSMKEAMKNESSRGYFNSAQAIADYAEILLHIKKEFSTQDSPIIVIGGSYGGMLAAWFRLKYPHIALGAFASSAPILYFDSITPQNGYYKKVTEDFKEVSKSCHETIRKSWSEIDRVASKPNGLSILSKKFKTCAHLNTSNELKDYLELTYVDAAQYNDPPTYPVTTICSGIDEAPDGTDTLGRIFAGIVAIRNRTCYDTKDNYPSETSVGWSWQTCSEMVMPIGRGNNDTMFPPSPFDLNKFVEDCKRKYGVPPRPHWITTYYGGHDIKLILRRFASNIIFSNGLRDPYSTGGVLEDISKSIVAVSTVNGSHCLDIVQPQESDPSWLIEQRKKEVEIIDGWIAKYYADVLALKK